MYLLLLSLVLNVAMGYWVYRLKKWDFLNVWSVFQAAWDGVVALVSGVWLAVKNLFKKKQQAPAKKAKKAASKRKPRKKKA